MSRELWDREAETFDDEPDHGLTDPNVRRAWRELLVGLLPDPPARVADLGCGTGSVTGLLVEAGYAVDGLDFSPEMVRRARTKVRSAEFVVGDASDPALPHDAYDVVFCRHVLWALPDPVAAVARWARLLTPTGRLVLVEGSWWTGSGLSATEAERIVRTARVEVMVRHLPEPEYWGQEIRDERYVLVSRR